MSELDDVDAVFRVLDDLARASADEARNSTGQPEQDCKD